MKTFFWVCFFSPILFLLGCGGGGGNPGECSGSPVYCAEFASTDGTSYTDATGGGSTQAGLFSKTGTGDTVFTIPANVTRLRIQGSYAGVNSNFIVWVGDSLPVNTTIGTTQSPPAFDGTYLVTGGSTVEIKNSSGVNWTITQAVADTIPTNPTGLYVKTGTGDTVFTIPANVTKIRIQGSYAGVNSNFIVWVGDSLPVNTTIGTTQSPPAFDGTYLVIGGSTVEIRNSSGVDWTFTQVP